MKINLKVDSKLDCSKTVLLFTVTTTYCRKYNDEVQTQPRKFTKVINKNVNIGLDSLNYGEWTRTVYIYQEWILFSLRLYFH